MVIQSLNSNNTGTSGNFAEFALHRRENENSEPRLAFDVAVLPSLSEGFSNVILEYMASSKPVVATNVGGIRKLLFMARRDY